MSDAAKDYAKLLGLLKAASNSNPDGFSAREFAQAIGVCTTTGNEYLTQALNNGFVERVEGKRRNVGIDGIARKITVVFRLTQGAGKRGAMLKMRAKVKHD